MTSAEIAAEADFRVRVHKLHNYIAAIRMYADLVDHEFSPIARAEHGSDIEEIRHAADSALEVSRGLFADLERQLHLVRNATPEA